MSQITPEAVESAVPPATWRALARRAALIALAVVAVAAAVALWLLPVRAAQAQTAAPPHPRPPELRIGYQKAASIFVLQKAQGTLERRLAPLGVAVRWVEFPAGPQLLEGLNVGSIDVGYVGEAPPIFAQAAGARFVYIGNDPPAPQAEALIVPASSAVRSVADLRGRKIALNKGSNVHYLLVRLLEKHGLKYSDVQPVFLPPADARAAFERGAVDAWLIWDPFLAAAERQIQARVVADGRGLVNNHLFYLAERGFAERHPQIVQILFDDLAERGRWITANVREAATQIAPLQGLDVDIVETSLRRYPLAVRPVTAAVLAEQQRVADTFFELKLIPRAVQVREAVLTDVR